MRLSNRTALLAATGLLTALSSQALAQNIAPQENASEEVAETGEIVVTGFRASAQAAVLAKKNSLVVIDAISQDDIGRLPDLNVVESARRIAGLSTVGGLDATKNRDIYQRVTIRGLDPRYNLITVDGSPLASSEYTVRGARLEQLPASLVARIESIKTVTAEYDPHALGGQLNLVTKSAFDSGKRSFFAVNAYGGINSTSGDFVASRKPSLRADATGAVRFGSEEQFGLVVSAEYQKLYSSAFSELPGDTNGNGWTYYTAAGAATPYANLSSTGFITPIRLQDFRFDNERTRASVNAKLEYRTDNTRLSAFAGYYHDKDEEFRAEILTTPGAAPTSLTASSGSFATGQIQQGIVLQPQERETKFFNLKGDFDLSEDWALSLIGSYSDASYHEQRIFQKWAADVVPGRVSTTNNPNFGYSYEIINGVPRGVHNDATLGGDPDAYRLLYVRDVVRDSESDVLFGKAELAYNAGADDHGFGIKLGSAFTRTKAQFDQVYSELTAANAVAQSAIGGLGNFIYLKTFSSKDTPQVPYLVVNPGTVTSFVAANPDLFIATNQIANNFADDFTDVEETKGLYGQALWHGDRFTLLAGVRYDRTDLTVDSFQAPTLSGSTAYEAVRRKSDYEFFLPSVLASYQLTDDMRFKAAFTKTIGRPDYSQYAARTSLSASVTGTLTINTGNPDLKPREALNYDFSYEWYLPGGGLLAVAAFYKDLKNEIFTATQAGPTTTYQGVTYTDVVVSQPLNSASGHVKGLEISYSDDRLDFLPDALSGVGIAANFTLLDGSFDLPMSTTAQANGFAAVRKTSGLIQQPDYIANATLFYADGPFEGRLSYNRIGRALQQASSDTSERDLYQEPRDQLDLQLRYELFAGFDAIFQVQNLTKEPFVVRQGADRALINNYFPVGRNIWFGISWKP